MATRNFVPRSGSEGQIGTQAKPWGVVVADIGHFATLSGSISGSQYSTGSFGRLHVAGDSNINGDVTIGGNINIGDSDTDSLTIAADLTSNLVPNADSTFNIGSSAKNWKVGHIEQVSSTNITASSDISSSGDIFGTNLLADSASFSTRVTNLKSDSGSFSTRITADSSSFSTRITDIVGGDITLTHVTSSGDVLFQSDLTVDGKVTAQEFHTEVVSSSIIFSSGSTIFGDTSDDTHRFTGSLKVTETGSFNHLIVLGNITASGVVRADAFESVTGGTAIDFNDSLNITGNLTASGDLSIDDLTASGNISGSATSTGSFHHIKSNKIQSTDNGGLRLFEHGGSGIFVEDGGRVGIGDLSPESTLKITGDLTVSTNITASNNIKMGGKIVIDQDQPIEFHQTLGIRDRIIRDSTSNAMNMLSRANIGLIIDSNNDDADAVFSVRANGYTHAASTPLLTVTQQHEISGSAASTGSFGRLETAGNINSDGRIYEQDTSVIDHATAMAIVFGG